MPIQPGGSADPPLTLVDSSGAWIGPGGPDLDGPELERIHRDMTAIQLLDERLALLVGTGKSSIMTSAAGHEAAHVGIARAVRGTDWVFPYYRDQGLLLALGVPPVELFGQMLATRADPTKGRQIPTHTGSRRLRIFSMASPVGSHLPAAVGAAMALQRREPGAVVVCTFGDGATSTGDFHGALTMAGVQRAPIVFVCENNRYAISVGLEAQTASATFAGKAAGYGMPGRLVDGLDVLAVRQAMGEAIDRAGRDEGPTLVELCLYRYRPHSSSDDDTRYRKPEEIDAWRDREPVARYRRFLISLGLWDETAAASAASGIRAALAEAVDAAEAAGPIPAGWMFDDVFAKEPWHLAEQRAKLEREIE